MTDQLYLQTPEVWRARRDDDTFPHLLVKVIFPDSESLKIKSFATDLPNYSHFFLKLGGLHFGNFELKGSNLPITGDVSDL